MKRERCVWIMLFIFLAWTGPAFSESTLKDMRPPEIDKITGEEDVYLEPTKFPVFSKGKCRENQKCSDWVEKYLSGKNRAQALLDGYLVEKETGTTGKYMVKYYGSSASCFGTGAFDFTTGEYSKAGKSTGGGWISLGNSEYTVLEFNKQEENTITIPAAHRTTAKVHFTWTVRVEGIVPNSYKCFKGTEASGIQMQPLFCSARHSCSINQDFSGGQIKMRLYIKGDNTAKAKEAPEDSDWAALDPITEMTLPVLKSITSTTENTPGDPTTTGSRMVTKDDFINLDGKPQPHLPKIITYKLMWQNDSPVVAKSLGNQRNIKVLLVPVTDIKEE